MIPVHYRLVVSGCSIRSPRHWLWVAGFNASSCNSGLAPHACFFRTTALQPGYALLYHHDLPDDPCVDGSLGCFEHYDFPGRFKQESSGQSFTDYRFDALRQEALMASGRSNVLQLQPGHSLLSGPSIGAGQWALATDSRSPSRAATAGAGGGSGLRGYLLSQ